MKTVSRILKITELICFGALISTLYFTIERVKTAEDIAVMLIDERDSLLRENHEMEVKYRSWQLKCIKEHY